TEPLPLPGGATRPHGFALSDDFTEPSWGWRWTFDQPDAHETDRAVLGTEGLLLAGKGTDPATSSPMTLRAPDRSYRVETSVELVDGGTTAGLLLFFNHRLFLGLELAPGRLQAWTGGTRTWGSEPLDESVTALDLAITKRENIVDMHYRLPGSETWTRYPLTLECSGYHANTVNDLVSL
ncbi:hypothetical protein, partial [Actinomyces sp. 186855]